MTIETRVIAYPDGTTSVTAHYTNDVRERHFHAAYCHLIDTIPNDGWYGQLVYIQRSHALAVAQKLRGYK